MSRNAIFAFCAASCRSRPPPFILPIAHTPKPVKFVAAGRRAPELDVPLLIDLTLVHQLKAGTGFISRPRTWQRPASTVPNSVVSAPKRPLRLAPTVRGGDTRSRGCDGPSCRYRAGSCPSSSGGCPGAAAADRTTVHEDAKGRGGSEQSRRQKENEKDETAVRRRTAWRQI